MDRTYLFVPPEEKAEVQSLGAQWDGASKRWYIGPDDAPARFSKWLASGEDDEEPTITSSEAYVAAATIPCQRCRANIEVICIHCGTGMVSGEPLTRFTVSDVWEMDEGLIRQLRLWPMFRRATDTGHESGTFVNHCPHCGAQQDDLHLHSEPESPFFDIPRAAAGLIRLTPLVGPVRLSGDEHFTVD
jgi:hypothetical protein